MKRSPMNAVLKSDELENRARTLLSRSYEVTGKLTPLGGENNNFLVESENGRKWVLKIASAEFPREIIEMEHAAIEHANASGAGLALSRTVLTNGGNIEADYEASDHSVMRARLLEYINGTPWIERAEIPSTELLRDLGRKLATLDRALGGFSHPAAFRTHRWDITKASQHRHKIALVENRSRRRILESMFHFWQACAAPHLKELPHSFIHADANDENILVENDRVVGLLDFGDSLVNPTVCELAIAIAYAMLDQNDPLQIGAEVASGYNEIRPLSPLELLVLFPLICGRMCMSVAVAAERRRIDPNHPNWFITEERAWRLLEKLADVNPATASSILASRTGVVLSNDHGSSPEVAREKRRQHISDSLSISYPEPLKIVRGEGQYLYDHRGRPFLDLVNNVCHVGHCHPRVVAAGQRQMALLNTNTRYLYDGLTEYAERLCATLPDPFRVCFLVNSGSEANELALRLARAHTGRRDFLVVDGAYHGNTSTLIALSPYKFMGRGGAGSPEPWVHVVPSPDGYRGIHKGLGRDAGEAYGDEVGRVIAESASPIAGFLTESLQSCGGQIIPPVGYLETAFRHVRSAGGVCIVDEVQVGFGRVGTHFWGFELQGIVPDIVVMGKPIGNGHPLAAVVTTPEIATSFNNGMEFFSTFGGNPVSCAIGLAVLDVIEDEGLQEHALKVGNKMLDGLRELAQRHPLIGDVRGSGLFIGVELVRDHETLSPATEEASEIINRMKERGMLLSTDGPLHNVLKIKPPLVITEDDTDMVVRSLDDVLFEVG